MHINFTKAEGLGNDLILVDAIDRPEVAQRPDWPAITPSWCDRHTGIGADALILIVPASGAEAGLRIYNADGSPAAMCGNGTRCVARYLVEQRGVELNELRLRTASGLVRVRPERRQGRFISARVDMGVVSLRPGDVPVLVPGEVALNVPLPADLARAWAPWATGAGLDMTFCAASVGNPHAVIFCRDLSGVPLSVAGPAVERHAIFPQRTNVHFVQVESPSRARMLSWERGVGSTRACGSGACAVAAVGLRSGRLARTCELDLPGGRLQMEVDESTGHVFKTGPANLVYSGTLDWPDPGAVPELASASAR